MVVLRLLLLSGPRQRGVTRKNLRLQPFARGRWLITARCHAAELKETVMQLKDAKLFRQQAYINGAWLDADNGQTIKVNNPATNEKNITPSPKKDPPPPPTPPHPPTHP